jgi:hypothetical protein
MVPKYWRHCGHVERPLYGYTIVPPAIADLPLATLTFTTEETSDIRVHFTVGYVWTGVNAWRRYDCYINRGGVDIRAARGLAHNNAGQPSLHSCVAATIVDDGMAAGIYTYKMRHHANGANDVRIYDWCFDIMICRS